MSTEAIPSRQPHVAACAVRAPAARGAARLLAQQGGGALHLPRSRCCCSCCSARSTAGRSTACPASQALLAGLIGYGCANTAFAGLAIQLVHPARVRDPEAAARDAAARADLRRRAARLDAARVRAADGRAVPDRARVLRDAVPDARSARSCSRSIIGAAAFAALGVATSVAHPLGGGIVRGRQLHPAADGVPHAASFGPTRHYPSFLRAIGDVLPLKYFIDLVERDLSPRRTRSGRSRGARGARRLGRRRARRRGAPVPLGAARAVRR